MALHHRLLASGSGWRVDDAICTSGPHDRPFEELHRDFCIAAVTGGTFRYRSARGSAVLAPGALLLGNHGDCFECSHEHSAGDHCLSFHFDPDFLETICRDIPGVRRMVFAVPRLPPHPAWLPLVAAAEAAGDDGDPAELEELALRVAGAACGAVAEGAKPAPAPTARDERRITAALRHIEAHAEETLPLSELAQVAAMSRYHFLRTFRAVVGATPHQFILQTRLKRAAVRLRHSADSVASIAFATGFGDLSTFNRRFQRVVGQSPSAFRA